MAISAACEGLAGTLQSSGVYEAVTWAWFFQIVPAALALFFGFFSFLLRQPREPDT